jgi:hypothetical protein
MRGGKGNAEIADNLTLLSLSPGEREAKQINFH